MTFVIHPVILCGGSGTRLWPLSTPKRPKQFLALTSPKTMIEETAARFQASQSGSLDFAETLVIGSKQHADLLDLTLSSAQKVLEPFGRNSAPAVAAACLALNEDDLIIILPADHDIQDVSAFHAAIETAAAAAMQGAIVTFGIEPSHPATGYGYIRAALGESGQALNVEAFVEKPDLETAKSYLEQGSYFWNAGIFLFQAKTMLEALRTHAPDVLTGTEASMTATEGLTSLLDPTAFAETPSISIDYAVMEHASNVKTVPVNMGWSDVGGYRALHELMTAKTSDNYTSGPVVAQNATGNYIRSEGPAIAVNGVSNLVIIATGDEVMITPLNDDGAAKGLGQTVQAKRHSLGLSPELIERVRTWLWTTLDVWSNVGWDATRGGFVEQLHMDGTPDADADRRTRVQARQVFSFCKAIEMGWPGVDRARTLIENGLDYIDTRLRHPEGGFVHRIKADGTVIDDRRDLYDHAFFILAGAAAYRAIDSELGLKIANDAIAYIDRELKDHDHGGWFESSERELPRRANPHMHMLEAMLEYHAATGSEAALDRAAEIVRLFETKFFNPATDVMAEFFEQDWSLREPEDQVVWEPGHHYEWATLLYMYEQVTGHDSASWRRRLIVRADHVRGNTKSGFVTNSLTAGNIQTDSNSRLWHQLERLRALNLHQEQMQRPSAGYFIESIFEHYLDVGPRGGWIDEIGGDGQSVAKAVPASMLYHGITAFHGLV